MERGIVTALALNGACAIHDWEIAYVGQTSEKVSESLESGNFGMVHETPKAINAAAKRAAREGLGFGEALGQDIEESTFPYKSYSLIGAAYRLGVPLTLHVSIGCDTVHMHGDADGASIGAATMTDFRRLLKVVLNLESGIWLNVGSAVVLPEVFLKVLSMARNLEGKPQRITTADLDMIRHYRTQQNVLARPGGPNYSLTGHHEIMIPLLRWGVMWELEKGQ
jgi:hypothetical protein